MPRLEDITEIQEALYELKIGDVMTREVLAVRPDTPITEFRALLRRRRISGVPVLSDGRLMGIASVDDLIRALAAGAQDECVDRWMTHRVLTVYADEPLAHAVEQFDRHGVGRLPVIDRNDALVGIITMGDVIHGLLSYHRDWPPPQPARRLFEHIDSNHTELTLCYRIKPHDFTHGGEAAAKIKRALSQLGAPLQVVRRVAIIAYEAEMNIVIHTVEGGDLLAEVSPDKIRIVAQDSGPGIPDLAKAMQPGFTTAPDWVREMGFGAGLGLNNIHRCADTFDLQSEVGIGTVLDVGVTVPAEEESI